MLIHRRYNFKIRQTDQRPHSNTQSNIVKIYKFTDINFASFFFPSLCLFCLCIKLNTRHVSHTNFSSLYYMKRSFSALNIYRFVLYFKFFFILASLSLLLNMIFVCVHMLLLVVFLCRYQKHKNECLWNKQKSKTSFCSND